MKGILSTQHDVMSEVGRLQDDYKTREAHKKLVTYDTFFNVQYERDTGRPERGYGCVLPRHPPNYRKPYMVTTYEVAYKYPFDWTPIPNTMPVSHSTVYHHNKFLLYKEPTHGPSPRFEVAACE